MNFAGNAAVTWLFLWSFLIANASALTVPQNSLFQLHAEPGARYLVEADPRFTNYRTFLSSDYFLQALKRDPERELKRYGDGFTEQKLINDQVLAGDIDIAAQKVDVNAAIDSSRNRSETRFEQSGLTLAVSNPVISALQGTAQMASAAGKTNDPRMKALAAVQAALSAKDAVGAVQAMAQDPKAGVGVNISLGASRSENNSTQSSSTAVGSKIAAGGKVSITATGAGSASNLNVTGSEVLAGGVAALKADGAVNLTAAQNTAEQHSTNSGSSASVGVGINFGGSQNGISINASASKSRGYADGTDVTWSNTHVSGDKVGIVSGGDTTIKGAVVQGNQVTADIKGNLNIESLQDVSTYDAKQQSAGAGVSVCVPPLCYGASSVSANYSNAKVNGNYASVVEQSGIKAGDGGFQLEVKGNTDLKGAVIASSEQAIADGRNGLVTATLTTSDIQNHDSHDASGISLGVSFSGKLGDQSSEAARKTMSDADIKAANNARTGAGMAPGLGQVSGSQASVTESGVSGATIAITDEQGQQEISGKTVEQTVASLNRDVTTGQGSANALVKGWNGQQLMGDVQAQVQITGAALPRLAKEIGDYAGKKAAELRSQGNEAEAKKWDEGGAYRVAAHAVLGALGGGLSGAVGAGVPAAAAPMLNDVQNQLQARLSEAGMGDGAARAAAQLIAGGTAAAIGGAVGGGAGALTALNADANNRQLHMANYDRLKEKCRGSSSTECQTINRMAGVQSGMPVDDPSIPASKVVANYDANGNVVSYVLIDRATNQPTMILEPLDYAAYRNAPPGTQALMKLSPQYALDFASAGLYASVGDNSRATEHVIAGVTSRDYVRDVALGVAGAAVSAATVVRPAAVNPALLNELSANGVKFTPQNIIATGRNANGQVVFLETGNAKSGLQHIIGEHGSQFAQMGVSEAQIPGVVMRAVTEGKLVGYQGSGTGRPIYEININGQTQRIAVTVGDNGYIVGANPRGSGK